MKTLRVELTTVGDLLGTASANKDLHGTYIASKAPDAPSKEEEIAAIGREEMIERAMTVFPRDEDGNPIMWSYQIRGFFKSACQAMKAVEKSHSSKLKAYKKEIDLRILVYADANDKSNRMIPILFDGEIGECQRPLRAATPQGERVSIAHSEMIPAGAKLRFDIVMLVDEDVDLVREWLDYGIYNGLGQWRNSGCGAFTWEEISLT